MTEQQTATTEEAPTPNCPKCQGPMWDNRVGKRNPKAPDFKCKDRECDGVIWPPRDAVAAATATTPAPKTAGEGAVNESGLPNCPICGGPMWADRLTKRNPKAPDFKCRNKPKERGGPGCEGIIWPPRAGQASPYPPPVPRGAPRMQAGPPPDDAPPHDAPPPFDDAPPFDDDDLPF